MPSAKMVMRRRVPPLNRSIRPRAEPFCPLNISSNWWVFTPGVGIHAPSRYTARMPMVKSTRLRRSGIRKIFRNFSSIFAYPLQAFAAD